MLAVLVAFIVLAGIVVLAAALLVIVPLTVLMWTLLQLALLARRPARVADPASPDRPGPVTTSPCHPPRGSAAAFAHLYRSESIRLNRLRYLSQTRWCAALCLVPGIPLLWFLSHPQPPPGIRDDFLVPPLTVWFALIALWGVVSAGRWARWKRLG